MKQKIIPLIVMGLISANMLGVGMVAHASAGGNGGTYTVSNVSTSDGATITSSGGSDAAHVGAGGTGSSNSSTTTPSSSGSGSSGSKTSSNSGNSSHNSGGGSKNGSNGSSSSGVNTSHAGNTLPGNASSSSSSGNYWSSIGSLVDSIFSGVPSSTQDAINSNPYLYNKAGTPVSVATDSQSSDPKPVTYKTTEGGHNVAESNVLQNRTVIRYDWEIKNKTTGGLDTASSPQLSMKWTFTTTGDYFVKATPWCHWDIGYIETWTTTTTGSDGSTSVQTHSRFVKTGDVYDYYYPDQRTYSFTIGYTDLGKETTLPPKAQQSVSTVDDLVE